MRRVGPNHLNMHSSPVDQVLLLLSQQHFDGALTLHERECFEGSGSRKGFRGSNKCRPQVLTAVCVCL